MGRFLQTDPMGYRDSMNLYQSFNCNPINFTDPMGEEISGNTLKYWGSYEKALDYVKYNYGLYLSGGDSADTAYKKLVSNGLVTAGDRVFTLKLALSPSLDVFDVTPAQFGKDVLGGVINAVTSTASMVLKGSPGAGYNPYAWSQLDNAKSWVQGKVNNAIGANEGSLGYWIGETYAPAIAGGYFAGRMSAASQTQFTDDIVKYANDVDTVELYRAVGPDEFEEIMGTNSFKPGEYSLSVKQFGRNFDEVLELSNYLKDTAAIVKTSIPKSLLVRLDLTPVDEMILKSGTVTVTPKMLGEFNKLIKFIEHIFLWRENMLKMYATINLLKKNECEIDQIGFSGMMPSFNIEGKLVMCEIVTINGSKLIERGIANKVEIRLPYGEKFKNELNVGYKFKLNLGEVIIGYGEIEEIL